VEVAILERGKDSGRIKGLLEETLGVKQIIETRDSEHVTSAGKAMVIDRA